MEENESYEGMFERRHENIVGEDAVKIQGYFLHRLYGERRELVKRVRRFLDLESDDLSDDQFWDRFCPLALELQELREEIAKWERPL